MEAVQEAKAVVLQYFNAFETASVDGAAAVLKSFTNSGYGLRGVHPFNELQGTQAVASALWDPLRRALTGLQRRQDIFMAAPNRLADGIWVTSMGKFMGLFDREWLGIPPTGKIALLPYCEFHRVTGGKSPSPPSFATSSASWYRLAWHRCRIKPGRQSSILARKRRTGCCWTPKTRRSPKGRWI